MYKLSFLLFLFSALTVNLQGQIAPTDGQIRLNAFKTRQQIAENSLISDLKTTSIGPSIFSCRVTDIDANPEDPTEFYVSYASAGLWYTASNGTRFTPVFDREASMTIGDIAVDWKRGTIWVGTGEANSSRSSYAGTGIYKSADKGKTWQYLGLPESHHISRILLDPNDPNTAWVAVLGHLYSPNPERGIYKTTDGGQNWKKVLFVNENSGGIDLVVDPLDPNTLYAATWTRERRAWNFTGCGEGSGIWKSTDKGETFTRLNTPGSGFPTGSKVGRIGLAAGLKNNQVILYAFVDNQTLEKKEETDKEALKKDDFRTMDKAAFAKIDDARLKTFLKNNDFPEKYSASKVKDMVEKGKISPQTLVEYLEDANTQLFETNFIGAELYRSENGGQTWVKTHSEALQSMFFSYGYYFSTVYCEKNDADQVYLLGFYILNSQDGGKTFSNINGDNVHVDHHSLWLNPHKSGHIINGNDGGVNISYDTGVSWYKCNNPPVGQFYGIAVDGADPYRVYGGAQDNGVWIGPSDFEASDSWHQTGSYAYHELLSGDGMQIQVDPRDNNTVYAGYQFGNYFRINMRSGERKYITPKHDLGERPYRWNWQTPICMSPHSPEIIYMGAQKLFRSMKRGEDFEAISPDLAGGGPSGNIPYGTLTTISESPKKSGLIYTGSDDGKVFMTRDGGDEWTNIAAGLPENRWVSRIIASQFQKSRVYVTLSGYRFDDFNAYLYSSENYGKTWKKLGENLPAEPLNVVREDPENENILYVGSDHGVYISFDKGNTFSAVSADFPAVSVHDLAIQSQAKELVIGTHGRSMFKLSIEHLQKMTPEILNSTVYVFPLKTVKYYKSWGRKSPYNKPKDPSFVIPFYASGAGEVTWTVRAKDGPELNGGIIKCAKGLNHYDFALNFDPEQNHKFQKWLDKNTKEGDKKETLEPADTGKYYLKKGNYTFEITKNGSTATQEFTIE